MNNGRTLSHFFVGEDVERPEFRVQAVEEFDGLPAEAALGCSRISFHEEHALGRTDQLLQSGFQRLQLLDGRRRRLGLGFRRPDS